MFLVVEHKTSSEDIGPGSTYWKRLLVDPQISNYLDGAESLGHPCEGVLYDVLRKPAHRPSSKGETVEAFGRRVLEAIAEKPDYYYQRGKIVRLREERLENSVDRWQTAAGIRDACRTGFWPRNADACMTWGRACDYLAICCGECEPDDPLLYRVSDVEHEEMTVRLPMVTQSSLRTYRACPRRYFFRYEKRMKALAVAKPLGTGKSVHAGLEVWWKTSGDITASLAALTTEDEHERAREGAMLCGYHARWQDEKLRVVHVEKEFVMPLVNPLTGVASRTFQLGGKIDAICEV